MNDASFERLKSKLERASARDSTEFHPTTFIIGETATYHIANPQDAEFLLRILHKTYTMETLTREAEKDGYRIGDGLPVAERDDPTFQTYRVYRMYDTDGRKFIPFKMGSDDESRSLVGVITTHRIGKK